MQVIKKILQHLKITDVQELQKLDVWIIGVITVVGLLSRLLYLGSFPASLIFDEADTTWIVYRIKAGLNPSFFELNWNGCPAIVNYMIIESMKIFGDNIFAIRFPTALISVGTLIIFYIILRRWFQIIPSIAATAMFTFSYWSLNFSRSGWENIQFLLPGLLAFYYIEEALEKDRWSRWILSGIFLALTAYGYYAGKIFAFTLILYLGFNFIFSHRYKNPTKLIACILISFVVFAPQLKSTLSEAGRARIKDVYAFSKENLNNEPLIHKMKTQTIETVGMINIAGSKSSNYNLPGEPQLYSIAGFAFLVGLILTILNFKKSLFWMLALITSGLIIFFSDDPPNAARGLGMLPSIFFLVALFLQGLYNFKKYNILTSSIIIIATICSIAWSSHIYIKWYSREDTLKGRNPAVKLEEFSEWSQRMKESFKKGGGGFNVGSWREYKDRGISLPK
ncbi:MAG: glycosyltransferase family 39 protein [Deltaproteobacteria bacterium]|nr:glycosyltransferase family 39 protein [Deltaproteobacteria bacterium]